MKRWQRLQHNGLEISPDILVARFPTMRGFHPLPCVMPLYQTGSLSPLVMKAALAFNDVLSIHRNRGVVDDCRLPAGRILPAVDVKRALPFVEEEGLKAGALWYDAMVVEPQRLLLEILRWAQSQGCQAMDQMEAVEVLHDGGVVYGVEAVGSDRSRRRFEAPVVVNMAGHWSMGFARRAGFELAQARAHSWAWNILFD